MGNDNAVNGQINVIVANGSGEINNVRFGIDKRPESNDVLVNLTNVATSDSLKIGFGLLTPLNGIDNEDGIYTSLAGNNLSPRGIIITTLPTNGTLYYQNNILTAGDTLTLLNPGDLYIVLTGTGYMSTEFNYAYLDAAGVSDLSPAEYIITWGYSLPVTWQSFNAVIDKEMVSLFWMTTQELGNKGFDIQRSQDGAHWETLGFVGSNQLEKEPTEYKFLDTNPMLGNNLYRIKQVDYNGQFEYSKVVSVWFKRHSEYLIIPNPGSDKVQIKGIDSSVKITVLDVNGKLVYNSDQFTSKSNLDISKWNSGYYNLIIQTVGEISTLKLIKAKNP